VRSVLCGLNPPAESGTSEGLFDYVLREKKRSSNVLDAVLSQPGIVPGQSSLGNVCWKGMTLQYAGQTIVLSAPDALSVVAANRSHNRLWKDPDVQFADQNLTLVSAYTATAAASLAVFNRQQIVATPETYFVEMFYSAGFNLAAPAIIRPTKPSPDLGSAYKIDDSTKAGLFIEKHRLREILVKAIEPLNKAFGESPIKTLAVVEDEEGSRTLVCLVAFPGSGTEARNALNAFDRNWWLMNAREFVGKLNFDFELV
jgi:hypothetical protein